MGNKQIPLNVSCFPDISSPPEPDHPLQSTLNIQPNICRVQTVLIKLIFYVRFRKQGSRDLTKLIKQNIVLGRIFLIVCDIDGDGFITHKVMQIKWFHLKSLLKWKTFVFSLLKVQTCTGGTGSL